MLMVFCGFDTLKNNRGGGARGETKTCQATTTTTRRALKDFLAIYGINWPINGD